MPVLSATATQTLLMCAVFILIVAPQASPKPTILLYRTAPFQISI